MPSTHSLRTEAATTSGASPVPATGGDAPAVASRHFRIDNGHHSPSATAPEPACPAFFPAAPAQSAPASLTAQSELSAAPPARLPGTALPGTALAAQCGNDQDETTQREHWLQLHATELIEKLQAWSADLDAREARLNARTAMLEHRERQLRLEQQTTRLDLDEMKQSLEQEVAALRAAARRLAFE